MQEIQILPFYQMNKPESVLENDTHKIPKDFEVETNHLVIVNKKETKKDNLPRDGLCCSGGPQCDNKKKKKKRKTTSWTSPKNLKSYET